MWKIEFKDSGTVEKWKPRMLAIRTRVYIFHQPSF